MPLGSIGWTHDMRITLYCRLWQAFGPYQE
jgi:hypothetical protein